MRFNIPLLPLQAEIRWRTLPPLRIRIWHWMSVVGVVGLFFSGLSYLARLADRNKYHAEQVFLDPANRALHIAESNRFSTAVQSLDAMLALIVLLILILVLTGFLGRWLNRIHRPSEPILLRTTPPPV